MSFEEGHQPLSAAAQIVKTAGSEFRLSCVPDTTRTAIRSTHVSGELACLPANTNECVVTVKLEGTPECVGAQLATIHAAIAGAV